MTVPWLEIGISAVLAVGFACVGEIVLRRRSSALASWNESLLAGMGACAATLFPLSLVFPTESVLAMAVLMLLASAWVAMSRLLRRSAPSRESPRELDLTTWLLLGATGLVALCFAALNFRYNYAWDGFQIWASKAQLLSVRGSLTRDWYPGDAYELRHVPYPPLVPLYESLLSLVRGGFDFDKLKPVFPVFYFSMLISMFSALRTSASPRLASVGTLMLSLVPTLSTRTAAGAYADMPQAAMLAGVVAACLNPGDNALPWLVGGLTTVKAEGTILAALACAGILLFWFLESPRGIFERIRREARNIAVVACLVGLRLAYVRWSRRRRRRLRPLDATHLREAIGRIPHVARLCLVELVNVRRWALLWPALLAAAAVLLVRGTARERSSRDRNGRGNGRARAAVSRDDLAARSSCRAGVLPPSRAARPRGHRRRHARFRGRNDGRTTTRERFSRTVRETVPAPRWRTRPARLLARPARKSASASGHGHAVCSWESVREHSPATSRGDGRSRHRARSLEGLYPQGSLCRHASTLEPLPAPRRPVRRRSADGALLSAEPSLRPPADSRGLVPVLPLEDDPRGPLAALLARRLGLARSRSPMAGVIFGFAAGRPRSRRDPTLTPVSASTGRLAVDRLQRRPDGSRSHGRRRLRSPVLAGSRKARPMSHSWD